MNSQQVRKAIHMKFNSQEYSKQWSVYDEFRWEDDSGSIRTIDVMVFSTWQSNTPIQAFEIKVNRNDFIKDIKEFRAKQGRFVDHSNMFWYVTPWGLVEPSEVPESTGLYWINKSKRLVKKKQAPFRNIKNLPPSFVSSLAKANSYFYDYDNSYLYLDEEKMSLMQAREKVEKFIIGDIELKVRNNLKAELKEEWDDLKEEKENFKKQKHYANALIGSFKEVFDEDLKDFGDSYRWGFQNKLKKLFLSVRPNDKMKEVFNDLSTTIKRTNQELEELKSRIFKEEEL